MRNHIAQKIMQIAFDIKETLPDIKLDQIHLDAGCVAFGSVSRPFCRIEWGKDFDLYIYCFGDNMSRMQHISLLGVAAHHEIKLVDHYSSLNLTETHEPKPKS